MNELCTADLVALAGQDDDDAWRELLRRHGALVWSVPRAFRLTEADAADVFQNTWLALAENLTRIREPARLTGWLITTARRETLRLLKVRGREEPIDSWSHPPASDPGPEDVALADDRSTTLWRIFSGLSERCQRMLRLLAHSPDLTYTEIARALGERTNNLGSTRSRCLAVFRRRMLAAGLIEEAVW
jgi:RNA polymerase sigma factor (sigma-70 family)